jgi:hypothetical protein
LVVNPEYFSMSKRLTISAMLAVAALTSIPATSEASDCLGLHRMRSETVSAVDGTTHFLKRVSDRAFGWIFCDKHRV